MKEFFLTDDDLRLGSEVVPGGILVYYADGEEEIIHVNQYVIDLFDCASLEEFMDFTGGSFKGFVDEDELNTTENNIWGQVDDREGYDHIYYQVRTKAGRRISIDDYGRLIQREGERPVFVVFIAEMDRRGSLDWLTGLPGMERFRYQFGIQVAIEEARGKKLAMAAFDLMGMRFYNARYGRDRGDELLKSFGDLLRKHFGSEGCCRDAGDSYFAFASLGEIENEVRAVFDEFAALGTGDMLPIMAGITGHVAGDSVALTMDRARFACYSDSTTWESHLTWYTAEMRATMLLRMYILEHIDQAIKEGWIRPHYQAVVRSTSGAICHEEALARWIDPEYGPLSPGQFIPTLEEAGLLLKLDLHIIDCVLADMLERRRRGVPLVPVSVNVSLRDIGKVDISREIAQRVDEAGIPHSLLRVEFTESAASSDPEYLRSQVRLLHAAGLDVWMDDFGSGYSSLNSIGEFDFDLIKLDMGFISGLGGDRRDIVVDGVIRASKRMGLGTLAEGIETQEQAELLAEMGCDMLQGFLYSRPRPLEEIMDEYLSGKSLAYEDTNESAYWRAVGSVSLSDLASNGEGKGVSDTPVSEFPAGVIELSAGTWRPLRANAPLRDFLSERGVSALDATALSVHEETITLDEHFEAAVHRTDESGSWERITGTLERGSGFQFHVCLLATCERARAYVVTSTPTLLGSALGTYGDVPVAYALLHVLLSEDGSEAVDLEYVYTNERFKEWSGLRAGDFIGKHVMGLGAPDAYRWLAPCYRAAMMGESSHEVYFSAVAGHWLSIDIAPTPMDEYCIFSFALADAEQEQREELRIAGSHDALTGLHNRHGFDEALAAHMRENGGKSFALVLVDVDDLRSINELYGRKAGDEALRETASLLVRAFPPGTIIGRNSRGEMVAAVYGNAVQDVESILERLANADLSCDLGGRRRPLSLSGGYTWCDGTERGLQAAFTRATQALAEVRAANRSGYLKWVPAMDEAPRRKLLGFTTRELAESMPLAMLAHRLDGEILVASKGLAHLLGYGSLAEALKAADHNICGFMEDKEAARMLKAFAAMAQAGSDDDESTIRARVRTASGDAMQVAYRARVAESDDGEPVFYAYMVDTLVAL